MKIILKISLWYEICADKYLNQHSTSMFKEYRGQLWDWQTNLITYAKSKVQIYQDPESWQPMQC